MTAESANQSPAPGAVDLLTQEEASSILAARDFCRARLLPGAAYARHPALDRIADACREHMLTGQHPPVNYRALLVKHIAHVLDCEGTSFVESSQTPGLVLTDMDVDLLKGLETEALTLRK